MFEHNELLQQLGDSYTNEPVWRFSKFAYIPLNILESIAGDALSENWGPDRWVLAKYLAVQVAWSIEQGRYTRSENQFYTTAGHLQTRYGTPLYLVFAKNNKPEICPWRVVMAGAQISAPELPTPPVIPAPPDIPVGVEIVINHDHILGERADRVPFLRDTPPVAQMCAVAGAIQWSLNRGLRLSHWYFGKMNYTVPLYLTSREDITMAPDLIAPIQVNSESLLVRTLLPPEGIYANSRVSVTRHDQLPHWLLSAWAVGAAHSKWSPTEGTEIVAA